MAVACPRCGANYDVTLFQFDRCIRCDCGASVDLHSGHIRTELPAGKEGWSMPEEQIGRVTHYFSKIAVAAIEMTQGTLSVGETIHVKGHTSDFIQTVDSMQVEGAAVQQAAAGENVGIKVAEHAREHDLVYKVTA